MMKTESEKTYIAIDLKSFYASVECVERNLDPMTTNLVVADSTRTDKTICLAVSPSLKAYGIPGRARLFEVVQKVNQINRERQYAAPGHKLTGASKDDVQVRGNPSLALDYHVAIPRMAYYIEYSTRIYQIYLRFVAPEDMHIYSIDEVFIDATGYLKIYKKTGHELARQMIQAVLDETGITATAGIGTNLYLCKIAMDIVAKHIPADKDGVRIAELDEMQYRRQLWEHRPLTDFWRVGRGYAKKLEAAGLYTMGDIARCSEQDEDLLYKMFGVNAELLIDHAWGWEPCTIKEIKAYQPENRSFSSGQVLMSPYDFAKARVVAREMAEASALDLLEKGLVTDQVVLTVGYDRVNLAARAGSYPEESHKGKAYPREIYQGKTYPGKTGQKETNPGETYQGEVTEDFYGRAVPKHAHGTANLDHYTSSSGKITAAVTQLFDELVDPKLLIRRITIDVCHVIPESEAALIKAAPVYEQLSFFDTPAADRKEQEKEEEQLERERKANEAMLKIRKKFGKNALLKGTNFEDGATGRERNRQIGGHKA